MAKNLTRTELLQRERKLASVYAKECTLGGKRSCACGKQCHGIKCCFCIEKTLRGIGVTEETLRKSTSVFRKSKDDYSINLAIAAIESEIK